MSADDPAVSNEDNEEFPSERFPEEISEETNETGRSWLLPVATAVMAILAVASVVAACFFVFAPGWGGFGWVHAAFVEQPRADTREAALDGARQAAVNLNSMNPDNIDGSIALMQSSSADDMLDQINSNRDKLKQLASSSKTRLESTVMGATITELNTDDDTAKAMVVLTQTSTMPDQKPTKQRVTWTLAMKKVGDVWKATQATSLGPPVLLDTPQVDQGGAAPPATPAPAPAGR
ncbi:hypothetical protein FOS14_19035 [Skermania sp. ID1734]|uniref:hypothetical protein n=1 Tax=Skermania sp. ID1734 TaxID=2597516 RepID=UPI00117C0372|nr:hypothetical protein [Skermania sp. ID1734]TSD95086.1 hypothetical protein FOS14_19035 [Skermania sp. ID1734]